MKIFQTLAIAAVALGATAFATPAQADDNHRHWRDHHHWDRRGGVVIATGPRVYHRPYYYDRYYAPSYSYGYARPYSYGPSVSFAFGGHPGYYHRWHR